MSAFLGVPSCLVYHEGYRIHQPLPPSILAATKPYCRGSIILIYILATPRSYLGNKINNGRLL